MAKDNFRTNASESTGKGHDQVRDGTAHGSTANGYDECFCDGSSYTKYGNRVDYTQLSSHTFK
jgi:hypothetical protein